MNALSFPRAVPNAVQIVFVAIGFLSSAWAQEPPSVKTGCNGQLSAEWAKIAAP